MQKTIGGDRLGAGKKMKATIHGYERSTQDLGYLWRSTMSAGTLVPFLVEVALPGDTFDIGLDCDIKTHPTTGPLFGSYKVQIDIFQAPFRLYQGELHNNKLGIGMHMANVKLPLIELEIDPTALIPDDNPDNAQINPSCILSYLGIRGVGVIDPAEPVNVKRQFNAIPLLAYWDIYKQYYANKQEDDGWVIHQQTFPLINTIDDIQLAGGLVPQLPATDVIFINGQYVLEVNFTGATPILSQIIFNTNVGQITAQIAFGSSAVVGAGQILGTWDTVRTGALYVYSWDYIKNGDLPIQAPIPTRFTLDSIDSMREYILSQTGGPAPVIINNLGEHPYDYLLDWPNGFSPYMNTQEGLALKTYQSDLFNNWMLTDWIDGPTGINAITAIDTTGGSFNVDTLILAKKVYNMLTRIAISGGSYDDWLDAVYTDDRYTRCESPIYHGGLIKELVFQEVISNSGTVQSGSSDPSGQPLGTLGGRGIMAKKHKGGHVTIKIDEPSYIIGIISLTPRVDYSQGNKWDTHLLTMDDLHKPALDEIGFQDLITEQMAWWTTEKDLLDTFFTQKSAGKQPAWINYMTNVNQVRGNFAIPDNEMFMTLNRRYEKTGTSGILDLTTYIDPSKFNFSFAQTAIDAQNFWAQIAVDIKARRKMSAKVMPNL